MVVTRFQNKFESTLSLYIEEFQSMTGDYVDHSEKSRLFIKIFDYILEHKHMLQRPSFLELETVIRQTLYDFYDNDYGLDAAGYYYCIFGSVLEDDFEIYQDYYEDERYDDYYEDERYDEYYEDEYYEEPHEDFIPIKIYYSEPKVVAAPAA